MPLFNTRIHPWIAKLKKADPKVRPNRKALVLFEKIAHKLSSLKTPLSNPYFRLPNDFCVSAVNFELEGHQFSIDVSVDYIASHTSGQAVQASFLVEKDGKGWGFIIHDPSQGVLAADWMPATDHKARTKSEIVCKMATFVVHLQQYYP